MDKKCVIIESPFRGADADEVRAHRFYAQVALRDSLSRGEAPFASHLFYTLYLNDEVPAERDQGMNCGWAWLRRAELVAVYIDNGISEGMRRGVRAATAAGIPVECRTTNPNYGPQLLRRVQENLLADVSSVTYYSDPAEGAAPEPIQPEPTAAADEALTELFEGEPRDGKA